MAKFLIKTVFLLLISVFLVLFMIFFNKLSIQVHIHELKNLLMKINYEEQQINHVYLIANYEVSRKLYIDELSETQALFKIFSMEKLLNESEQKLVPESSKDYFSKYYINFLNVLRGFMGKSDLIDENHFKISDYLSVAYYYERNRQYNDALTIYHRTIKEPRILPIHKAGILLHQGYCYALLGKYKLAKEKYIQVINNYKNYDIYRTAKILLGYLENFKKQTQRILKEKNSINKSKKLFYLKSYENSIKVIEEIKPQTKREKQLALKYIEGRNYEELGYKSKALIEYKKLIHKRKDSIYSKAANLRLYLMGVRDKEKSDLKDLAKKNNLQLKDEDFNQLMKLEAKMKSSYPLNSKEPVINEKNKENFIKKKKQVITYLKQDLKDKDDISKENKKLDFEGKKEKIYIDDNILKFNKNYDEIIQVLNPGKIYVFHLRHSGQPLSSNYMGVVYLKGKILKETKSYLIIMTQYGKLKLDREDIAKIEQIH